VERLLNRLKQFRPIATRYQKRAANYAAMLTVAAIVLWLSTLQTRPSITAAVRVAEQPGDDGSGHAWREADVVAAKTTRPGRTEGAEPPATTSAIATVVFHKPTLAATPTGVAAFFCASSWIT
jgi:hypothetical protein